MGIVVLRAVFQAPIKDQTWFLRNYVEIIYAGDLPKAIIVILESLVLSSGRLKEKLNCEHRMGENM